MGRVAGVDGIKTGYTRNSGFNLVTSMRRGGRHVVAVVLGGRSAGSRDAQMRQLLSYHIMAASTRRTAPAIAEAPAERKEQRVAAVEAPVPLPSAKPPVSHKLASADATASIQSGHSATAFSATVAPKAGSTDPIKPLLVKTLSIRPAHVAPRTARDTFAAAPLPAPPPAAADVQEPRPTKIAAIAKVAMIVNDEAPKPVPRATKVAAPERAARSGWMIQVGAFGEEKEARVRLTSAQRRAKKLLGDADPFTEPVTKGEKTFYRARFAGLDKHRAAAACRALKRNEIACLALKN